MKIGLLTFHDTTNFGSLLQTYGLYYVVKQIGYDCEVIDYRCKKVDDVELPKKKPSSLNVKDVISFILFNKNIKYKYLNLHSFLCERMKLSPQYNHDNIHTANERYDIFLVGGDILWALDITGNDYTYFLDFVKNSAKKYAFGTSMNTDLTPELKFAIQEYLSDFQRIAVREREAAIEIRNITERDIDVVVDPTMLVEPQVWVKLAQKSTKFYELQKQKYVLVYFQTDELLLDACRYAKNNNLKVLDITYWKPKLGTKRMPVHDLYDFLALIYNAQYVFTGSYHGMLFSLYFEKQFRYYPRAHRYRMDGVAEMLDIPQSCSDMKSDKVIDYDRVTTKCEEQRKAALLRLKDYLRFAEQGLK